MSQASFYDLAKTGQLQGPGNATDAALALSVATLNRKIALRFPSASAAGNVSATLTAAAVKGGILTSAPAAANITLTSPTAALLVAEDPKAAAGEGYEVTVINTNGTYTVTLAGGTGVTIVGSAIVAVSSSATFILRYTNVTESSEAVVLYRK